MRTTRILLLALLPALAFELAAAAPKRRRGRKPPKPPPAKTEPAKQAPAPTPDAPEPARPAPASAPPPAPAPTTSGAASPAATTTTAPGAGDDADDAPADGPDVDALRQQYLALRDELFASRARASTVASQLFSTRIQVKLTYTTGRFYSPAKATIRLDGANVYDDATGAIASNDALRFEGYVAPGRHVLTFRVEATGKDDDSFSSVTETQVVVKAVAGKDLVVTAKARDGGDIAYRWKKSERGTYGLGIDVDVKTVARGGR